MSSLSELVDSHAKHLVVCANAFFGHVAPDAPRQIIFFGSYGPGSTSEGEAFPDCLEVLTHHFRDAGYAIIDPPLRNGTTAYSVDMPAYFSPVIAKKTLPVRELESVRHEP